MRALSLWQPWVWFITHGHKRVENRGWSTPYRGPLALLATKNVRKLDYESASDFALLRFGIETPPWKSTEVPFGCLVGVAELVDILPPNQDPMGGLRRAGADQLQWRISGQHAWVLENVERFDRPLPVGGAQGLLTHVRHDGQSITVQQAVERARKLNEGQRL